MKSIKILHSKPIISIKSKVNQKQTAPLTYTTGKILSYDQRPTSSLFFKDNSVKSLAKLSIDPKKTPSSRWYSQVKPQQEANPLSSNAEKATTSLAIDSSDLENQFNNALIATMQEINKNSHDGAGICYYEDYYDYCQQHHKRVNEKYREGFANPDFWEVKDHYTFKMKSAKKPSEAVEAFLNGLTVADCGNVVIACELAALLKVFGKERFDAIFTSTGHPLIIPQTRYDIKDLASVFYQTDEKEVRGKLGHRPVSAGATCYISGVSTYPIKHPDGCDGGFNLICAGKNAQDEDLFIGFWPGKFNKPLTEKEIIIELINAYNLDRTKFDNAWISASKDPSIYDMQLKNIANTLTIEEGFKLCDGYVAGSVVRPRYNLINQYKTMNDKEIIQKFCLNYLESMVEKIKPIDIDPYQNLISLDFARLFKRSQLDEKPSTGLYHLLPKVKRS